MFKLLQAVYDRILALKNGLTTNLARWTGQPDTPATLDALLTQIQAKDTEIKAIEVLLHDKREEARKLAADFNAQADQTERRASGIHAADVERLADYGAPVPGAAPARRTGATVPEKAVIRQIADDDDGEGFVLRHDKLDTADHYEIERGTSPADRPNERPATLSFLRTTKKLKNLDDDVQSGIRYWYRVRGVNRRGAGEWSEVVSAIQ